MNNILSINVLGKIFLGIFHWNWGVVVKDATADWTTDSGLESPLLSSYTAAPSERIPMCVCQLIYMKCDAVPGWLSW